MADDPAMRMSPVTAHLVAGVSDATAIAVGIGHACALRRDGTVRCWGSSEGDILGPGGPSEAAIDPGVRDATQVTAGSRHSCARLADGEVTCWGRNEFGALGLPLQLGLPPAVARPVAWR
jgi:alpha-tubulin suppressor-like RCC1 family protein